MDRWQPCDPDARRALLASRRIEGPRGHTDARRFARLGTSNYEPPFRSPPNFALLKDVTVGDFELTAKVQSTNVDAGPHRDMCIFWGYQDPSHFYYVHFGAAVRPERLPDLHRRTTPRARRSR